jgi:hypothetical protein
MYLSINQFNINSMDLLIENISLHLMLEIEKEF